MEGFLILAGGILGVVCLFLGRSGDRGTSPGEPVGDVGGGRETDSTSGLPSTLGGLDGLDIAGSAFGLTDESWLINRHHDIDDPTDDSSNGVRDAAWSGDPFVIEGIGLAVGIGPGDDFPVHRSCINPATGLPMISDSEAGFDVGGNPYGFRNDDLYSHDSFESGFGSDSHGFNDSFDHSGSGTDWT